MKWFFLIFVLLACLCIFYLSSFIKEVESKSLMGDWVCWVNSTKDNNCGVFAYSKSKRIAFKLAFEKCEEHCQTKCQLDYCELLKK